MSHLGMVHTVSGRGKERRNQALTVLSLSQASFGRNCLGESAKQADDRQTTALGERHCTMPRVSREGGSNNPPASHVVLGEGVAEGFSSVNLLRLTLKGGGRIHRR